MLPEPRLPGDLLKLSPFSPAASAFLLAAPQLRLPGGPILGSFHRSSSAREALPRSAGLSLFRLLSGLLVQFSNVLFAPLPDPLEGVFVRLVLWRLSPATRLRTISWTKDNLTGQLASFVTSCSGSHLSPGNGPSTTDNWPTVASFVPAPAAGLSAKPISNKRLTTINDEDPVGSFVKFSRTRDGIHPERSSRGGAPSDNGQLTTDAGGSLGSFAWAFSSGPYVPPNNGEVTTDDGPSAASFVVFSHRSPLGSFDGYSRAQLRFTSESIAGWSGASVSAIATAISLATGQGSLDNGVLTSGDGPIDN